MYHLIKKDILIQKRSIALSLLLICFFSVSLSSLGEVGLMVGILAITYQLLLGASALEDKNNSDKVLISLPIKLSTIVLSKYLSIYVYAAFAAIGFYLIHVLVKLFHIPLDVPFSYIILIGGAIMVTICFSISLPMIFKFGYLKAKMANFILLFVIVFGTTGIMKYFAKLDNQFIQETMIRLSTLSKAELGLILLIPLIILLVISYFISLSYYSKREF
ncbi:ABC-2 transporter permease [Niallia circulans]|uniref:ABC-2 transporter permease n=1 Tax=Niallia circulans TaxID=1397 RepID=UPI00119EC18D|nr:ABC-2 transporter permease [Niallia circulans]MED5099554.1 ABC-2 transporter permease [Niallia circulans]